jgi:hypothetical protein
VLGNAGTFWTYDGFCLVGFFLVYLRVPETKGKTLEEIERELNQRAWQAVKARSNRKACREKYYVFRMADHSRLEVWASGRVQ